jgi:hypothetical protein
VSAHGAGGARRGARQTGLRCLYPPLAAMTEIDASVFPLLRGGLARGSPEIFLASVSLRA